MILRPLLAAVFIGFSLMATPASEPMTVFTFQGSVVIQAEAAGINPARADVVRQDSFTGMKGVSLKAGLATNVGSIGAEPDLCFKVRAPKAGRYVIRTHAATDAKGREAMRQAKSKHESLHLMIAVGGGRPTLFGSYITGRI